MNNNNNNNDNYLSELRNEIDFRGLAYDLWINYYVLHFSVLGARFEIALTKDEVEIEIPKVMRFIEKKWNERRKELIKVANGFKKLSNFEFDRKNLSLSFDVVNDETEKVANFAFDLTKEDNTEDYIWEVIWAYEAMDDEDSINEGQNYFRIENC